MSNKKRLDLSTPEAQATAYEAAPVLFIGAALGNQQAADQFGQIMGHIMEQALRPGIEAMVKLQQYQSKAPR